MTRKHYSVDQLSSVTTRRAQSEAAAMQSEIKKLRDSLRSTNRSIKEPVIGVSRKRTAKTTTTPSLFGLSLGSLSASLGYSSASQSASAALLSIALGQRIR